jgi:hypothetical protein
LEWLDKTQKYRNKCILGGGTAATKRVISSSGSSRSGRVQRAARVHGGLRPEQREGAPKAQ